MFASKKFKNTILLHVTTVTSRILSYLFLSTILQNSENLDYFNKIKDGGGPFSDRFNNYNNNKTDKALDSLALVTLIWLALTLTDGYLYCKEAYTVGSLIL